MPAHVNFGLTIKIGEHYIKGEVGLSDIPLSIDVREEDEAVEINYEELEKEIQKAFDTCEKLVIKKLKAIQTQLVR